jgi:hypothetical protein
VDIELPTDPAAFLGDPDEEDKRHFLFPLAYLRKSDARTGFEVRDADGTSLTVPIRAECDHISSLAAAEAAATLHASVRRSPTILSAGELVEIFRPIVANLPFDSSLALQEVLRQVGLGEGDTADLTAEQIAIGQAWDKAGLAEILHMLVEHSLLWVPLHGRPGERRSILLSQHISLIRRAFVRWIFGDLKSPKWRHLHPFRGLRTRDPKAGSYLEVGDKKYGLRGRRISLSALAERIGEPLAWTPLELEFPTVHAKRCSSYHFELRCPPGRTPRDLRPASGTRLAERGQEASEERDGKGKTTLTARIARHDRPGSDLARDLWFRVSVGTGDGAFPALWFLTGAITALMLWLLADDSPELEGSHAEIIAGILLVVPALVGALALSGGDDVPITRLIGGARLLLLVTGLSTVGAAAVVAGAEPFGLSPDWTWTFCAIAATVATVPLGTSWLLSSPLVWSQLRKLRSWRLQRSALSVAVVLVGIGIGALIGLGSQSIAEGTIAVCLLFLATGITALANNRAAMPIGESRSNVVVSLLVAGVTCVALACIELRAAIDPGPGPKMSVEASALVFVFFSLWAGQRKTWLFELTAARPDEIHVSPQVGRALLAKEVVTELTILRNREKGVEHRWKQEGDSKGGPSLKTPFGRGRSR